MYYATVNRENAAWICMCYLYHTIPRSCLQFFHLARCGTWNELDFWLAWSNLRSRVCSLKIRINYPTISGKMLRATRSLPNQIVRCDVVYVFDCFCVFWIFRFLVSFFNRSHCGLWSLNQIMMISDQCLWPLIKKHQYLQISKLRCDILLLSRPFDSKIVLFVTQVSIDNHNCSPDCDDVLAWIHLGCGRPNTWQHSVDFEDIGVAFGTVSWLKPWNKKVTCLAWLPK